MSDSQDPKISVELEAVLGKLSADLKAGEAMVAQTTAKMTQTVAAEAAKTTAMAKPYLLERVANEERAWRRIREIRREAIMAEQREMATGPRAIFGTNAAAGAGAAGAMNGVLGAAIKVGFAIQAVSASVSIVDAATKAWKGDSEGVLDALERMPLGLGIIVQKTREMVVNTEQFRKETEAADAMIAKKAASLSVYSTLNDLRDELAILKEKDEFKRAELETEKELRQVRDQAKEQIRSGQDKQGVEEALRLKEEAINIRSVDRFTAMRQEKEEKALADKWSREQRLQETINQETLKRIAEQERAEKEAAKAVLDEKRKAIDYLIDYEREQISAMQEEMGRLGRINGGNFITSGSSALGTFSSAQSNGSRIVAESSRRQVELQQAILNTSIAIKDLMATKDGWN